MEEDPVIHPSMTAAELFTPVLFSVVLPSQVLDSEFAGASFTSLGSLMKSDRCHGSEILSETAPKLLFD